jgi:magnesium-transporting ATPase (P-type)
MSETDPLLPSTDKLNPLDTFVNDQRHLLSTEELFQVLKASNEGLTTEDAKRRRETTGMNYIDPPINIPSFLCCLLPCLSSSKIMKVYHETIAETCATKRNDKWVNLDSVSIVPGDLIRISQGDRVPADAIIIEVSL